MQRNSAPTPDDFYISFLPSDLTSEMLICFLPYYLLSPAKLRSKNWRLLSAVAICSLPTMGGDTPTQVYKYTSLPSKRCIRLLRIKLEIDGPIQCTLELADLTSGARPLYDCLSYTWGDPLYEHLLNPEKKRNMTNEPTCPIKCDGVTFIVTENLHEALLQLRQSSVETSTVEICRKRQGLIWIDAICINQEDKEEKGDQVDMMADIYRDAQNVIVWLGPDDSFTDRGIEVMYRLALVPEFKYDIGIPGDLDDIEGLKQLSLPYIPSRGWLALGTFFLRTWFRRIWVLQETFAAKDPIVLCGTHLLEWSQITAASQTLGGTRLGRLLIKEIEAADGNGSEKTKYVANTINNQSIFGDITKGNAEFLNLETLLAYSRYFGATKDQDRVYAVRGMWKPSPIHETEAFTLLKSNYDLSVQNVYTTASIATILEMKDLNILSLVEDFFFRSDELKDLPSWVPDYSVTPVSEPLAGNPRSVEGKERWNASAGLQWQIPPLLDLLPLPAKQPRPVLLVEGIQFEKIVELAASDSEITDEYQIHTLLGLLRNILDSCSSPYGMASFEAFWRTLIKDTFREEPAGQIAGKAFAALLTMRVWELEMALGMHTLEGSFEDSVDEGNIVLIKDSYLESEKLVRYLSERDNGGTIPSWESIQETIRIGTEEFDENLPPQITADYEDFSESFGAAYVGRRLFRTQGGYLGIGPQSLRENDQVWVLAGAAVPIVLRPLGKQKWQLVGEAYVHGIMNGEVVKMKGSRTTAIGLE